MIIISSSMGITAEEARRLNPKKYGDIPDGIILSEVEVKE